MKTLFNNKTTRTALLLGLFLLLFSSCSKEEFSSDVNYIRNPIDQNAPLPEIAKCAGSSMKKPSVDFLFLIDNSGSNRFMEQGLKESLANTISQVSENFDYRVMLAPLIVDPTDLKGHTSLVNVAVMTNDSTYKSLVIPLITKEAAAAHAQFISSANVDGSQEAGLDRAVGLLSANLQTFFRKNAYTIIVLMSDKDDVSYINPNTGMPSAQYGSAATYVNIQAANLKTLRDLTLKSSSMRFLSLVPHKSPSACTGIETSFGPNYVYKTMSQKVYNQMAYSDGRPFPTDQNLRSSPDSYDICAGAGVTELFSGVNQAIQAILLAHKYNYWPLTSENPYLDWSKITATKYNALSGATIKTLTQNDLSNGFVWKGQLSNQNTRYYPSVGESFTGHMIELFGDAEIVYPECLKISIPAFVDIYDYFPISYEPDPSSISFYKNSVPLTKGIDWNYVGYKINQCMTGQTPTFNNPQTGFPHYPCKTQTAYFIQIINPSHFYTADTSAELTVTALKL